MYKTRGITLRGLFLIVVTPKSFAKYQALKL